MNHRSEEEHDFTEIWIGEVGPIPVGEPTPDQVRQGATDAAVADALHTPADLQGGMYHERPGVRERVVPRLIARGAADAQTLPTLLDVMANDPDAGVRGIVAFYISGLPFDTRIAAALRAS